VFNDNNFRSSQLVRLCVIER